jgi:hypothetical protein
MVVVAVVPRDISNQLTSTTTTRKFMYNTIIYQTAATTENQIYQYVLSALALRLRVSAVHPLNSKFNATEKKVGPRLPKTLFGGW